MMHTYIFERTSYGKERELVKKRGERGVLFTYSLFKWSKWPELSLSKSKSQTFFFFFWKDSEAQGNGLFSHDFSGTLAVS